SFRISTQTFCLTRTQVNIDMEYSIPKKGGIKYRLILHKGANVSLVKMHYSGDVEEIFKDKEGNIIIETPAGDITDHAPESYYDEGKTKISSEFLLKEKTVSFQLEKNKSIEKTIVIDPWTTTPTSLDTNNAAYDIDFDDYGNVYVSGGTGPYKLAKYSNIGVLLWTFTNPFHWGYGSINYPFFYSKFCVIPKSGTVFLGDGWGMLDSHVMKIDYTGILTFTSSYLGNNNELWRMYYNNCSKQLIGFGGGTMGNDHSIKVIADTNLSSSTSSSFNGAGCSCCNDIASVVMENNGDFYALMTNAGNCPQVEGHLQKSLFSTNYSPPCVFNVQTGYLFNECIGYTGILTTVRANALALNNSYVYSYDGKTLKAWNKLNGSLLGSIIVDNNYIGGLNREHEGIDVDECNTVYVGGTNQVHVYSFNGNTFNTLTSITTDITGQVFDIKLNRESNYIYMCGNGFVTVTIVPIPCYSEQISTIITIDSCLRNGCLTTTGGIPPYSYQWSNGDTSNCIFSVPSGVYTVTVTDNSCPAKFHIDTISLSNQPLINLGNDTTICAGVSLFLDVSIPNGTYLWQDSSFSPYYNISEAGIYWVRVTNSCSTVSDTIIVEIVDCDCYLYFPNAFTPTKDNLNECFGAMYDCEFETYCFKIFDRWGEMIFETFKPSECWDGKYKGKDAKQDVYVWVVKYKSNNNETIIKRGTVTLVR
ncbi:MAG: gliding motility-associated C-terminal domain-containing protein, partial [Bacteroidota bacterium]